MTGIIRKGARITGDRRDSLASELAELYKSGDTVRSLARATGRSYGFIHRILAESGVSLRSRGVPARPERTSSEERI